MVLVADLLRSEPLLDRLRLGRRPVLVRPADVQRVVAAQTTKPARRADHHRHRHLRHHLFYFQTQYVHNCISIRPAKSTDLSSRLLGFLTPSTGLLGGRTFLLVLKKFVILIFFLIYFLFPNTIYSQLYFHQTCQVYWFTQ